MATVVLTRELLDELEYELGAQDAPCVGFFRPGLESDAADQMAAAHGLTLTDELRTWWGWHDGGGYSGEHGTAEQWIGTVRFAPLDDALQLTGRLRESAREGAADAEGEMRDPSFWWKPHWIALSEYPGGARVAECAREERPTVVSPAHGVDWANIDSIDRTGAESMGEMVSWWIDALRHGTWRWNSARFWWDYDWETLTERQRLSGMF